MLVTFGVYTLLLSMIWKLEVALFKVYLAISVLAVLAGARVVQKAPRLGQGLTVLTLCTALWNATQLIPMRSQPGGALYGGWQGTRGYAEAAQEVLARAPQDARIGALQSGALSYFARPGQHVVPLLGPMNSAAHQAEAMGQLWEFVLAQELTHIADWSLHLRVLNRASAGKEVSDHLIPVYAAKPQGAEQFVLYEIASSD